MVWPNLIKLCLCRLIWIYIVIETDWDDVDDVVCCCRDLTRAPWSCKYHLRLEDDKVFHKLADNVEDGIGVLKIVGIQEEQLIGFLLQMVFAVTGKAPSGLFVMA